MSEMFELEMKAKNCVLVCKSDTLLESIYHDINRFSAAGEQANVIGLDKIGGPNVTIVVDGRVVTGVRSMQKNGLQPGVGDCVVLFHGPYDSRSTNFGPGKRRGQYEIRFRVHEVGKMLDFTSVIVI